MSENETVMGVCAEWRDCIESADPSVWNDERIAGLVKTTKAQQLAYLDRIEAAWKREREELREAATEKMLEGATIIDNRGHGNAAAMREALEHIGIIAEAMYSDSGDCNSVNANTVSILNLVRAALAAPARQCDVGTAEEQGTRCLSQIRAWRFGGPRLIDSIMKWTQMPYEAQEGAQEGAGE